MLSYVIEIVCIRRADIGPLKICPEISLKLFPTSNGVFGKAFEPMPGWPFERAFPYFMFWMMMTTLCGLNVCYMF